MMPEPFVGEVRLFSKGGLPNGWAACNGVELPIHEYQPLFNLLGWRHGGDRMHTFALPLLEKPDFIFAMAVDGVYPPRPDEEPMDYPYVGEIRLFGGNFAPGGWAVCDGRELSVAPATQTLFELIGRTFGGEEDRFTLPDLRAQALPGLSFIIAVSGLDPRE